MKNKKKSLLLLVLLLISIALVGCIAVKDTSEGLEQDLDELAKEIEDLSKEIHEDVADGLEMEDGQSIEVDDALKLQYTKLNANKKKVFLASQSNKFEIVTETNSGDLSLKITSPKGDIIYQEDNVGSNQIEIKLEEGGDYLVEILANDHSGKLEIQLVK